MIGGVLYLVTVILCALSKRGEMAMGISPFRDKREPFFKDAQEEEKEKTSFSTEASADCTDSDSERSSREEQAERIRRLLSRQDEKQE